MMFAGANAADDDENLPSIDALMNFMTSFFRILRQGFAERIPTRSRESNKASVARFYCTPLDVHRY